MWVYRMREGHVWQVGYYSCVGDGPAASFPCYWVQDSEWPDQYDAAGRVHWLNGGELAASRAHLMSPNHSR